MSALLETFVLLRWQSDRRHCLGIGCILPLQINDLRHFRLTINWNITLDGRVFFFHSAAVAFIARFDRRSLNVHRTIYARWRISSCASLCSNGLSVARLRKRRYCMLRKLGNRSAKIVDPLGCRFLHRCGLLKIGISPFDSHANRIRFLAR